MQARRWCGRLVLIAAVTSAVSRAGAQSVVRVLDRDSIPVPFALVQVKGGAERVADSLGRVRLAQDLAPGTTLQVRRLGYAPFMGPAVEGRDRELVVLLEPVRRELEAVRTVAPRSTALSRTGFYDRMQRVQQGAIVGWFVTPEELEQRKVMQVSRALQGVGSTRIARHTDGRPIVTGRGDCPMTVLVDGQRQQHLLKGTPQRAPTSLSGRGRVDDSGGSQSVDELVEGGSVMAIEIYPSAANAPAELIQLTGGGSCGIVAIWTGPRQ
jgi:hypothetical protein